jgi:hypothetical protein
MNLGTHKQIVTLIKLPISYFGPIAYYSVMVNYPNIIEAYENYQKRSIRNRAHILSSNGPICLSVPLEKGKTKKLISEVRIAYHENWQSNHRTAIVSAYGTAPYFDYYYPYIEQILSTKYETLFSLFEAIQSFVCRTIGIESGTYTQAYDRSTKSTRPIFIGKDKNIELKKSKYTQVFSDRFAFNADLSILDLIFNRGPEAIQYLRATTLRFH